MKRNIFLISTFCLALLFSCNPDRRTAEGEDEVEAIDKSTAEPLEYEPASDVDIDDRTTNVAEVKEETVEFVKEAAKRSMAEIELAQLALKNAQTEEVKEFAQMIVNDHQMANEKLMKIVQQEDFSLPQTLEGVYAEKAEKLTGLEGIEFDKEYIELIEEMHDETIDKYEGQDDEIYQDAIREWVDETLPVLREHYQRANQIEELLNEKY